MAGLPWDDDVASVRADENLSRLAVAIPSESSQTRRLPTDHLVRSWHREMVMGVEVPDDAYRGGFRGDPHPALFDYEVEVAGLPVTRSCNVGAEVDSALSELRDQVSANDILDDQEDPNVTSPGFIKKILETASWLHCEWVRIHPFVNGNGRTARMWVLWICGRYGLPQILPLRPRPGMAYNAITQAGIIGEHGPFLQYLLFRYNQV